MSKILLPTGVEIYIIVGYKIDEIKSLYKKTRFLPGETRRKVVAGGGYDSTRPNRHG